MLVNFIKTNIIKIVPTLILVALTKENYGLRKRGIIPDVLYWADEELVRRNYQYFIELWEDA